MPGSEPAVDRDGLSGDPGSFVGCKEEGGSGDIVGFTQTAERMECCQFRQAFRVGEETFREGRSGETWAKSVDADAERRVIHRHIAGKGDDRAFTGGISGPVPDTG